MNSNINNVFPDEVVFSDEVVFHTFSFLDAASLVRCCQVNRQWRSVASDNRLWRQFTYGHFVDPHSNIKEKYGVTSLEETIKRIVEFFNEANERKIYRFTCFFSQNPETQFTLTLGNVGRRAQGIIYEPDVSAFCIFIPEVPEDSRVLWTSFGENNPIFSDQIFGQIRCSPPNNEFFNTNELIRVFENLLLNKARTIPGPQLHRRFRVAEPKKTSSRKFEMEKIDNISAPVHQIPPQAIQKSSKNFKFLACITLIALAIIGSRLINSVARKYGSP